MTRSILAPLVLVATLAANTGCSRTSQATAAPSTPSGPPTPADLLGSWVIDLRQSPEDAPASTTMVIEHADGGTLRGSFYQSSLEQGRVKALGDEVYFSFVTEDGSGPYFTAGRLGPDGTLRGMTNSTGRDFLNVWTGRRAP